MWLLPGHTGFFLRSLFLIVPLGDTAFILELAAIVFLVITAPFWLPLVGELLGIVIPIAVILIIIIVIIGGFSLIFA